VAVNALSVVPSTRGGKDGRAVLEVLGLDELGIRVFRAAARHPGSGVEALAEWTGLPTALVASEVCHQRTLGLLRANGLGWAARDPVAVLTEAHAQRAARTAAEQQARRDERVALARSGLFADYLSGRRRPGTHDGIVDVLRGEQIWARLAELAETAGDDLRFLMDGGPVHGGCPGQLADAVVRAHRRGVRVAAVWTPDVCPTVRDAIAPTGAPSGWVRERDHVPMRALVADGATALVPVDPANLGRGAFVVAAPELVAGVGQLVGDLYDAAMPVSASGPGDDRDLEGSGQGGRRLRAVVALLAAGYHDEAIAGQLGVHPRTVRGDVDALMARHNVRTRFALGAALADTGLIP
jgi:DNA-binding CsgD family transcriptional regulator